MGLTPVSWGEQRLVTKCQEIVAICKAICYYKGGYSVPHRVTYAIKYSLNVSRETFRSRKRGI